MAFIRRASVPFQASYNSACTAGDDIDEGDDIVMYGGKPWHEKCARDEDIPMHDDAEDDDDDFFGDREDRSDDFFA